MREQGRKGEREGEGGETEEKRKDKNYHAW